MITSATLLGALSNLSPLEPMTVLVWAAIVNGLVIMPVTVPLMFIARNPRVMGEFCTPRGLTVFG